MKLINHYHGKFLKRYKRFFADVEMLDGPDAGKTITAHTPNTGSMKGCLAENCEAIVTMSNNPKRKLKYTLELIRPDSAWIGVNTTLTNKLVNEALINEIIVEAIGYKNIKPEAKIGESRLDFFLSHHSTLPDCYIEVKNVTLKSDTVEALFPDAKTERGVKHLNELIDLKLKGYRSILLFVVQREDVNVFNFNNPIDPLYTETLKKAYHSGVEILAYQCSLKADEIKIERRLGLIV